MIYFISGLGADHRVFQFLDLSPFKTKNIAWEIPYTDESFADYCRRLIKQIDVDKSVVLIGVSFGGMVAQEIAHQISCDKVIIIHTVPKSVSA